MSQHQQEEIELSNNQPSNTITVSSASKSFYDRKRQSKLVRVFTVLAYVLSVSLAAIILSIYYIFMWDGKPSLSRHSYLRGGYYGENGYGKYYRKVAASHLEPSALDSAKLIETLQNRREDAINVTSSSTNGYVKNPSFTLKEHLSSDIAGEADLTSQVEEDAFVTTPSEENSTWLPDEVNDFDGDYNEFQTEPIFIKRLFGYHKARIK